MFKAKRMMAVVFLLALLEAPAQMLGVGRTQYLDLMERAVSAYSEASVEERLGEVERVGVQEHGFPRLAANLGVLVANGRMVERKGTLARMMTACCRDARKGRMPPKSGGNEFSVKELVFAVAELERSGAFPKETTDAWRADLAAVVAENCYTRGRLAVGADRAHNWVVFAAASEQARIAHGMGGNPAFVEKYVNDQLRWFDDNGMYKDPGQPFVYDFVTRLQFMHILDWGYNGPSRAALETQLEKSAKPTLAMLSACGEIPYGGRSNQFLHNHTLYAAVCEWYAARFAARGDAATAERFAEAAYMSVEALGPWLRESPVSHVKNRYPRLEVKSDYLAQSDMGCERYAYFDKYMVTMGSWSMSAFCFSKTAPGTLSPSGIAKPSVFATTPDFHSVFLSAGGYSAQFDYNADVHYDCDGLGRVHRRGAPSTLCLSTPCAKAPDYRIEETNDKELAIAPIVSGGMELVPVVACVSNGAAFAEWRVKGHAYVVWRCSLAEQGLVSVLTGEGPVALSLPAFSFDGRDATVITAAAKSLTIAYRGWECVYETNGRIVDTGRVACNRNGRYRRFEARGEKVLEVRIAIVPCEPLCNAADCQGRDGGGVHDFVWENDKFGMRAYGPGDYHVWSGLDVFNKNVSRNVCIEWMRDPIRSTHSSKPNLHDNLGEGMDNYTLGAARGVGGVALYGDGEWKTYGNWESCRRIHVGDDYLEFELVYPAFCAAGRMTYHITLRRGDRFFRNDVSFERMPNDFFVGPGIDLDPGRGHQGDIFESPGVVSLFEEPKGEDGEDGSAMSAVFVSDPASVVVKTDHMNCRVLAFRGRRNFTYWAGASWSCAGEITSAPQWHAHVRDFFAQAK